MAEADSSTEVTEAVVTAHALTEVEASEEEAETIEEVKAMFLKESANSSSILEIASLETNADSNIPKESLAAVVAAAMEVAADVGLVDPHLSHNDLPSLKWPQDNQSQSLLITSEWGSLLPTNSLCTM